MSSPEDLKNVLEYRQGKLFWKTDVSDKCRQGMEVGSLHPKGYIRFGYKRKHYLVHRVIWYLFKGSWPKNQIDHLDRDKTNNRIENLRDVIPAENSANTGKSIRRQFPVGVRPSGKKFRAFIIKNKIWIEVGSFKTIQEAQEARNKKFKEVHGV